MADSDTTLTNPRRSAWLWWGLAALSLLLGYADLVRGGITLAPILLVLGSCAGSPVGTSPSWAAASRSRRGE